MSTAVAAAVPTATSLPSAAHRNLSPHHFTAVAPAASTSSPANPSPANESRNSASGNASPVSKPASGNASPVDRSARPSPKLCVSTLPASTTRNMLTHICNSPRSALPPIIKVKKEPGSPSIQSARHRPKRLDLSSSTPTTSRAPHTGRPSAPLTSRESAGLAVQDVGLACLSPGFQTNDPGMREQLQRSLDVRDQQRLIIEARQKGVRPSSSLDNPDAPRSQDTTLFGVQTHTPTTSRRKGPPPGLSISAPSAAQFANDRVIQSAPLHQTFTGLRPDQPYSRHVQHAPSALSQTSHIHHVPATQTNNRLPPIADVFANDRLDPPRNYSSAHSPAHSSHSNVPPPVPSPAFPPSHGHHLPPAPLSARPLEFRSAEEAVQGLSGGRDDLLPKLVHYGGVQPPTPPSPMSHAGRHHHNHPAVTQQASGVAPASAHDHPSAHRDILGRTASLNSRRRDRDEYERDNGSPPSLGARPDIKRTTFTVRGEQADRDEDWRSGLGGAEKKEEFLRLCERAWDLFHS